MRYLLYCVFVAFCCMVVAACAPDAPPQQQKTVQKSQSRKKAASRQVVKEAEESDGTAEQASLVKQQYSYSSAGKPDPFMPLIADAPTKTKVVSQSRDRKFLTPLQKYDLKDLKLVAVVVMNNEPTAMLEDPTGYGYVIRQGMLVGSNDGVVERVMPTGLIIREKVYNSLGEIETKISTLTIQHAE